MNSKALCLAALVVAAVAMPAPAAADEWNQKTIFTFNGAIELPGTTLPEGTYTFRLMDTPGNRHVVQVFNENETKLITTLMAVSAQRNVAADVPMVNFAERSATAPPAVQYWFYPGRTNGHEFVYPRAQAIRIAKASNKPVLATASSGDTNVTRIDPRGQETDYTDRSAANVEREPANPGVQSGQSVVTSGRETRDTTSDSRGDSLPQTASGEPMLLLLAVSSFLGLSSLGFFRRRF